MTANEKRLQLRKSIPGQAPDCRFKRNPAHSERMKARWIELKRKLAQLDDLLNQRS